MQMQNTKNSSYSLAPVVAAICSIVFVTIITLAGELVPPLKDWLKGTFSHHWLGKSVISVAVFLVIYVFIAVAGKRTDERGLAESVRLLSWLTILGTLIIYGFFIYETFLK